MSTSATSGRSAVLLFAQLLSVSVAARVFRRRTDGPLISFWMYGNPTFWTAPVAAAALGAEAAVFVIAYDMLTQARIALGVRYLRAARAEVAVARDRARRLRADLRRARPASLLGLVLPAPDFVDTFVAGARDRDGRRSARCWSASPGRSAGSARRRSRSRCAGSRCTGRSSPAVLAVGDLAGVDLPGAVWILALGPIPTSVVSFAQLYGYSPRTAATGSGAERRRRDRAAANFAHACILSAVYLTVEA